MQLSEVIIIIYEDRMLNKNVKKGKKITRSSDMLGIKDDKSIHPLKKGRELKHGSAFQRKRITVEKEKTG